MKNKNTKKTEKFITDLVGRYEQRQSIHEPLARILGDYGNVPFLRAVRNVMFDRIDVPEKGKPVYLWKIKESGGFTVDQIFAEERRIKMIAAARINEGI